MFKSLARNCVRLLRTAIGFDANQAAILQIYKSIEEIKNHSKSQSMRLGPADLAKYSAIMQAGLSRRGQEIQNPPNKVIAPLPEPSRQLSYETVLGKLRSLRPELFDTWSRLYEHGARGYYDLPIEASCSTWNNEFAGIFKYYVDAFGHGAILDLGCGPRIVPSYLRGFDPESVCAIEPLELSYQPPFHVERTFAEFLPWADASFDSVICGTSLDHVLSLTTTLTETRRVLKPGGVFINWLSSLDGAAPYDERRATPVDNFHLFQFNLDWAIPLFENFFDVIDLTRFRRDGDSFEHVFLVLRKRRAPSV